MPINFKLNFLPCRSSLKRLCTKILPAENLLWKFCKKRVSSLGSRLTRELCLWEGLMEKLQLRYSTRFLTSPFSLSSWHSILELIRIFLCLFCPTALLTAIRCDRCYEGSLLLQGLDDLGKRAAKYYEQGARFAKWRAVLQITATAPSPLVGSKPATFHDKHYHTSKHRWASCLHNEPSFSSGKPTSPLSEGFHAHSGNT